MNMKMEFSFLYKNGMETTFVQEASEKIIKQILDIIENGFESDRAGFLRLADGEKSYFIRLSDVSQVSIKQPDEKVETK